MKDREEFGSGNGTTYVYIVEAQSTHKEIIVDGDPQSPLVLTPHEWKRVPVNLSTMGVPNHMEMWPQAAEQGFLTYECAMALACWFQATRKWGGIITRLVQIEFTSSFSTKLLGRSEPLDLYQDGIDLLHAIREKRSEEARAADAVGQR